MGFSIKTQLYIKYKKLLLKLFIKVKLESRETSPKIIQYAHQNFNI